VKLLIAFIKGEAISSVRLKRLPEGGFFSLYSSSTFFAAKESGQKETAVMTPFGGKLSLRSLKVQSALRSDTNFFNARFIQFSTPQS
jgi:hypothetical protein